VSSNVDKSSATQGIRVCGEVAVIGMACTFPKARDVPTFWQNIVNKVDAVEEVPRKRWDPDIFYDPDPQAEGRVYCKKGGYLDSSFAFNPLRYGTMPKAIESAEPDQFLVLRCAHEAMDDAGYLGKDFDGVRAEFVLGRGNYLGAGLSTMLQRSMITEQTLRIIESLNPELSGDEMKRLKAEMWSCMPEFTSETAPGLIPNITTGRVANRLDFMSANFTVDAACASSLIATEIAVRSLLTGYTDLALAGGVHVFSNVPFLMVFGALGALSYSSVCRPFDRNCDGTISGEGVGILVLKRLQDAERDGDRIYAVIKGVGSSSDGKAMSVTAPRVEGEVLAIRRALEMSGVAPESIGLIEAHGTGTTIGDTAELQALTQAFGTGQGQTGGVALGSVKSMIGHAMPAAGSAALIKTVLALYHRVLPPTLNCREPHELLQQPDSRFYVNTETRPWIHGDTTQPRRAGIDAFGFGGVNAHVVLEEYRGPAGETKPTLIREWETELCVIESDTRAGLIDSINKIRDYLSKVSGVALRDVAYSLNTSVNAGEHRLAVVASSLEDLDKKLSFAAERLYQQDTAKIKDTTGIYYFSQPLAREGKIAYLFPGEGSQYVNMLADLCIHFPEVQACFEATDGAVPGSDRYPPSRDIFPKPYFSEEEAAAAEARLCKIERATEAVLTANGAIYTLLQHLGIEPDMIAGHSAGEWAAMVAAGIFEVDEFVASMSRLDEMYININQNTDIPKMSMLAAGASREKVLALIAEIDCHAHIANDNCPHQVVIVVQPDLTEKVIGQLQSNGVFVEQLPFDRGYHTPSFTYICDPLREYFSSLKMNLPGIPLYSCTTARPFPEDCTQILDLASRTFAQPIVFRDMIEAMYEAGARLFVEVGPRNNLSSFVDDILRGRPHVAVAPNLQNRSGITTLNHALGILAAQHVKVDFDYLYKRREPRKLSFDARSDSVVHQDDQPGTIQVPLSYPEMHVSKRPPKPVPGPEVRKADTVMPITQEAPQQASAQGGSLDAPVSAPAPNGMQDYFQTMEVFLQTQKKIMAAYLGTPQEPSPAETERPPADIREVAPAQAPSADQQVEAAPVRVQSDARTAQPDEQQAVEPAEQRTDLQEILVSIVSDRTGYPPEMLDLDLDMEADLGIDSIKRVEILGALQNMGEEVDLSTEADLEQVAKLKTLRQVIAFLEDLGVTAPSKEVPVSSSAVTDINALPFKVEVISHTPGVEIEVRRLIDLQEDLYLEDHRFGPETSETGSGAAPVPVVPLTVSVEMMAEVASILVPGLKVIGIRDVVVSRWIDLEKEDSQVVLKMVAVKEKDGRSVRVEIYDQKPLEESEKPIKPSPLGHATILFGSNYPDSPNPETLTLKNEKQCMHTAEEMYTQNRMFHGPSFQGVVSLDAVGENGLLTQLEVLPRENLIESSRSPEFHVDPFFLDAVGQLVGYWPVEYYDEGFVLFPIRLEELVLYRASPKPGTRFTCQMRIREISQRQVRADLDVIADDGKLWMRVIGWEDWRFYWPKSFYEFWRFPNKQIVSQRIELPLPDDYRDAQCCMLESFGEIESSMWENLWAHLILNRKELAQYHDILAGRRRTEWVFGRAVAKDAVRLWIKRHYGLDLYPADIHVRTDQAGKPYVEGFWSGQIGETPHISISHKPKAAVAIAGRAPVGIDLEQIERRDESFDKAAFDEHEQTILQKLDETDHDEWVTRLWCAKEAAGKALGIGMKNGPGTMAVRSADPDNGRLVVVDRSRPQSEPVEMEAHSMRKGDFVLAAVVSERNGNGTS